MLLTPVNLYKYPGTGSQLASTKQEPTWLSSSHWEQTKHVSVQWVHYAPHDINASVDIVTSSWHCHASRDTAWLSCITPHGHTSNKPKLWWVSRHLIGLLVSMLASDWLLVAQPWLVICIILASLARHDWARLSTLVIMNIHRPKNGLPVMSDFWDIQISNVIIMAPEISRQHHYVSSH